MQATSHPPLKELDRQLLDAAGSGDVAQIAALLKAQANINARDEGGNTALMFAARHDRIEAVKLLISKNADVTAQNSFNQTALTLALREHSNEGIALALIAAKSPLDLKDRWHHAAAYYAAQDNLPVTLRALGENKADLTVATDDGITPLMHATRLPGHHAAAAALLEFEAGIDLQAADKSTALMMAAGAGDEKLVADYLGRGANMFLHDSKGRNARDFAKTANNSKIEKMLDETVTRFALPLSQGAGYESVSPAKAAFRPRAKAAFRPRAKVLV